MRAWGLMLLGLALAAGADEPATHPVALSLPTPCSVRWRLAQESTWHPAGSFPQGTSHLSLPAQHLFLQAERSGWLTRSWGEREVYEHRDYVNFESLTSGPNWLNLGALALLLGGGGFGWFWKRSRDQQAREAEANEPLIRADGQVPKRKLGPYRLTSILGSGGMGVVYRAEAADGIPVAIKVPAPHLISQGDFRLRFMREIELGLRLEHPNLVRVMALPLGDEPYLVLEFVPGQDLSQVPPLPWPQECRRCLDWADQVLDALAYIHSKGIVHRDLKPGNLMAVEGSRIKLMDFGIAHKLHGTRLTGTDTILGTPVYMAPEQLMGQPLDGRADLYALGVILYERLAGGLPFPDDVMEMLRQKMMEPLRPLNELLPEVSPELSAFVDRLVAVDAADRFPDASAALLELRRFRKGT